MQASVCVLLQTGLVLLSGEVYHLAMNYVNEAVSVVQ